MKIKYEKIVISKVRILSDEIDRLQGVIQDNEEEIIRWRNQYYDFSALDNK